MKKYLQSIVLFLCILFPSAYATPIFSHPVLQKANDLISVKVEQKTSNIILDENSRKTIEQKKENLTQILISIDQAFQKKDKVTLKAQAILFRNGYKELILFIQNLTSVSVASNTHKNIQRIAGDKEITGTSTDITYYADSFEGGHTANGNSYSQSYYSAAGCLTPFNTLLQIGKGTTAVIVKLNDRPNCTKHPNLTDLTTTAFKIIGKISSGRLQGTVNTLGVVSKNYTKKIVSPNTFGELGISLDTNIPNTYLKNETLHITGKELDGKEYTVLYLKSPSGKEITLGSKKWWDWRFEYNYPLEEVGIYQMVIAAGLGFKTSTFLDITVLEDSLFSAKKLISPIKTPGALDTLDVERIELPDLTSLYLFHFASPELHTLTLTNGKETYIYKGFSVIAVRGDTFRSMDITTPISVEVTTAQSSTVFSHDTYTIPVTIFSKTMTLTPGYKEDKSENITVIEENGSILIRGVVPKGKNVKSDIMITLPNGNVEKYSFDRESIDTDGYMKRDTIFEKTIPIKQIGLYLVEVNYDNGFAAYNGPITYGDILPVYPNEYDSVEKNINKSDSSRVAIESLKSINNIRARSGKPALSLDDTLNNLATIKANDMATHNNLSHTDSNGDKIAGTAKRNNIEVTGGVGENIAGGNINYKALLIGLANSGGHRANMLDSWKKMGIGYTVQDGQVYYVQVFGE